ncbi:3-deoxy-7-phosphoheptulonate synthase [Buchnera aphidicola]|uniref:Phospho-2-dehydro-3-deoxyheptonate aldolase n=1 Tax=Buchnera aphidicola str. USDA (Myzus persicae) TaxID=1009856 RepID=W0P0G6_BUCMP|nr:3-deoxy-7-phosphoheptulonate synthase [Buchnera aphidicola]AHG60246.1 Aroh [Buchnera aphidicola str. USDA (Myzus persicae)]AHG60824.1 Aroh [Buchnera aphidicola str. W106 (Myzus persicae)]AHG61396.1 Aroh [Buchnera aphidicola str. G002 (Myzus persicae)]AHG61969.1 Aroh [Buchnera aphidicola str. F009 (Myzus persicae)]WAI03066.1 MAG: 3-deoxy-7-phosphoheptulonate synthase [Buchnera aphidicola (Myzus persicae)]
MKKTDELRTIRIDPLITPFELAKQYSITSDIMDNVITTRQNIARIMTGEDLRLLVVIGPCSVHDPIAAVEYAHRLYELRVKYKDRLEIIMRTYFEKPRTVVGWKGLISDPDLNGSFRVNHGLAVARKLLLDINALGMPAATEFLDMVIGQFIADLISWGAIGARTTESQIHREMASALSCPVGFKNGTDGNIRIAIDAIRAAKVRHLFLAPNKNGQMTINHTSGNPYGHIIMRGGRSPNYHADDIDSAVKHLREFNLVEHLMIDFSHGNCLKEHLRQKNVAKSVASQISNGSKAIFGVMIESFLEEGFQKVINNQPLIYGKSITDACLNWKDSTLIIQQLADAVDTRF